MNSYTPNQLSRSPPINPYQIHPDSPQTIHTTFLISYSSRCPPAPHMWHPLPSKNVRVIHRFARRALYASCLAQRWRASCLAQRWQRSKRPWSGHLVFASTMERPYHIYINDLLGVVPSCSEIHCHFLKRCLQELNTPMRLKKVLCAENSPPKGSTRQGLRENDQHESLTSLRSCNG